MSVTFTDDDLVAWEAYASSGDFGLAITPRVIFNCLSDPSVRARFVKLRGDEADAEAQLHDFDEERLRQMLRDSEEIE
jgi:hypothetical protein